ncbi:MULTISPECIES: methane monooxygenase/ammonia monooxygenase subunit C, partial [Methylococcus]
MATTTAGGIAAIDRPLLDKKWLVFAIGIYTVFYLWVRWYEGVYGWSAGLDSFAP